MRWQESMPASTSRAPWRLRKASATSAARWLVIQRLSAAASTPTWEMATRTSRPSTLSASAPPCLDWKETPMRRLADCRKWRAELKAWKPTTSASSSAPSSSSRTGMVRKISEVGKGACIKKTQCGRRPLAATPQRARKRGTMQSW